jgi:hypothetical protein
MTTHYPNKMICNAMARASLLPSKEDVSVDEDERRKLRNRMKRERRARTKR